MKHWILPGFFFILMLTACEISYYSVLITNNSSKDITYKYNGALDTLAQGESKTYQVKAGTQAPHDIHVMGAMSIQLESRSAGAEYVFTDITALGLHVLNTLGIEVILIADNYIDNDGENSLIIPAKSENKTAKIYTKSPRFAISSNYSPNVEWNIDNNIMYVTIK
jgi:hypothetical protein